MGILGGRNTTKSLHDLWKRVFRNVTDRQKDRQTSGHHDSRIESAKWADSVNIVRKNLTINNMMYEFYKGIFCVGYFSNISVIRETV